MRGHSGGTRMSPSEDALAALPGEFERRDGVVVFFLGGGHPVLDRRHAFVGPAFVAHDRIGRKTLRRRFGCAGICNLKVALDRDWKLKRRRSFFRSTRA
jgi:hypothetical protein